MSTKNKHNKQLGSDIIRTDDRIRETGEIFTPDECIRTMVSSVFEYELKNNIFLDYCAGNGNFSAVLLDSGVPPEHIYGIEYMEDNFFELCERLKITDQTFKLMRYYPLSDDYEEIKDSSQNVILKRGNYLRCDVFFPNFNLLFDDEEKLGYTWMPV